MKGWAPVPLAVRAVVVGTGAVALLVAPGGQLLVAGVVALVGALGLAAAAARPDGPGPAIVLGAAAAAWTLRYGLGRPPVVPTLVLAVALALHHQSAALAAALPPGAEVDPAVPLRFALHAALVLAVSGPVAAVALGAGRPGGSVPLEIAGLLAVAVVIAVPIFLRRRL
jgi:hypothetical protein